MQDSKRNGFLNHLQHSDSELANKVTSLLDYHDRGCDTLEETCDHHQKIAASTQLARDTDTTFPTIHGYEFKRRIGSGGQADVYLATQESTGQGVAVKVFRGLGLTEAQRGRIDGETKALVRLQIPNVVPILDRGQLAGGEEYLITRFVDGLPIDQAAHKLLRNSTHEFLGLFIRVAETLSRVHREGILHRDLKPSNILVDHNNEPYLLDFGLARFFADPTGRLLTATPDDAFQGSILWASPEQLDTSFGKIDQRSDLYSLGVILYQSAIGQFPYPVDGGILGIAQEIVRTRPMPFDATDMLRGALTQPEFEGLVLRTLDKRQHRRFQSAEELTDALRVVQQGSGVGRASVAPLAGRTTPFQRIAAGGVAFVGALLLISCGLVLFKNSDVDHNAGGSAGTKLENTLPTSFDDELGEFGKIPANWKRVGKLESDRHEIKRTIAPIEGDFSLIFRLSASKDEIAGFVVTLIGTGGDRDLRITAEKTNTWSDNENWVFQLPSGIVHKSLPIQPHTLTLQRDGELFTLSADAVFRSADSTIGQFAAADLEKFGEIRISSSGRAMKLKRVVLETER